MRRREFLGIIGWPVAWPISSKAQTTERTRFVGILDILGPDDPEAKTREAVFAETLQQLGWEVGRNLKIETRNVWGRSRTSSSLRGRIDRTYAGRNRKRGECDSCAAATSDPYHPGCVRECSRPGWCWLRGEHGAPRRQYHWIFEFRIQHEWKMGLIAQANCS